MLAQVKTQIAVVQAYCNHCTGKTPQIDIQSIFEGENQLKLAQAANWAHEFFARNNGSITFVINRPEKSN